MNGAESAAVWAAALCANTAAAALNGYLPDMWTKSFSFSRQ